ncbi:unnamed protein product [Hydatigera taeniaeformis]|uniref:Uncharacterized protein n=1 Tax=Hydatigena taeniaeformis TaxID=6205 RepID=A0A0R3XAG3_HYDTA|nr:unnamed protein product [Hydatigera taeniaeformis]
MRWVIEGVDYLWVSCDGLEYPFSSRVGRSAVSSGASITYVPSIEWEGTTSVTTPLPTTSCQPTTLFVCLIPPVEQQPGWEPEFVYDHIARLRLVALAEEGRKKQQLMRVAGHVSLFIEYSFPLTTLLPPPPLPLAPANLLVPHVSSRITAARFG